MQELLHKFDTLPINVPNLTNKFDIVNNSKPYDEYCQIKAKNDVEATSIWLKRYQDNLHTYRAYKREAERLLLWCVYEQSISFNELKSQDLEQYFAFLSNPSITWLDAKKQTKVRGQSSTPFAEPLAPPAKAFAKRALNSLLNFLVDANYLRSNPLKLLRKTSRLIDFTEQKYKVWERMLEEDEWQAVQLVLQVMPEGKVIEVDNKMRTQFLFALLYFLGLRINEVATHTWSSFRKRNEQWWFFVKGKGGKLGHIPVNDQLLAYVKNYRLHLAKPLLPKSNESEALLVSANTKKPLKIGQLYNLVKTIGNAAAEYFSEDAAKREKLKKLSPHWLRHLSASHQDKVGIPASIIQSNHRHSSPQTTQIYVHAEEARRFTEMQKMQMNLQSRLLIPTSNANTLEITMKLTKGPVNKVMGFRQVIAGIEDQVLMGSSWTRIAPIQEKLANISEQDLFQDNLLITYHLHSQEAINTKDVWERAFLRMADIWMFAAKVNSRLIEVTNGAK